jgi:hypothetical protein
VDKSITPLIVLVFMVGTAFATYFPEQCLRRQANGGSRRPFGSALCEAKRVTAKELKKV